jgi:hypothetical protein
MVYTNAFVVDLSPMQSIKQLTNDLPVYGLYKLSIRIVRGSTDDSLSKGCTCPNWKKSFDLFFSFISPAHSTSATRTPLRLLLSAAALLSAPSHYPPRSWPPWPYQSRQPDPPVSLFNFPPSLSLHGSMAGCPSPTTTRRMHGPRLNVILF